ncbi:cytochrome c3 family protein [Deferribacterales bacterium Es71-Z0220]|jgi:predicted CXXCH cytochrome family protein|uniref:cytochrome c3 family protein n=1 Tax=Deferrivibrio essentukiensis TaxID=2880922 RepID=UPI001F61BE1E|nr:cytochrome c3 family protein [Deferrivibrio essentukiensis]MCB4204416.1 cytochrome c3 family protein [Deferrivibrio essentukiensis]
MKKLLMLLALLALPTMLFAAVAGTAHDFSSAGNNYGTTACSGCHKPHNAGTLIPLWNDSNKFDDTTYAAYSSPTDALNQTPGSTLGNVSQACMACHDGMVESVNVDFASALPVKAGITTGLKLDYTNNSGGQHPVAIKYDDAGTNTALVALATVKSAGFKFYGASSDTLECATCHDPHDDTNGDFLRASKTTLCQTCHNN